MSTRLISSNSSPHLRTESRFLLARSGCEAGSTTATTDMGSDLTADPGVPALARSGTAGRGTMGMVCCTGGMAGSGTGGTPPAGGRTGGTRGMGGCEMGGRSGAIGAGAGISGSGAEHAIGERLEDLEESVL